MKNKKTQNWAKLVTFCVALSTSEWLRATAANQLDTGSGEKSPLQRSWPAVTRLAVNINNNSYVYQQWRWSQWKKLVYSRSYILYFVAAIYQEVQSLIKVKTPSKTPCKSRHIGSSNCVPDISGGVWGRKLFCLIYSTLYSWQGTLVVWVKRLK